jgi:sulfur-carrier protein
VICSSSRAAPRNQRRRVAPDNPDPFSSVSGERCLGFGSVAGMSITVRIPTTMRPLAGGSSSVKVEGSKLSEVLANLNSSFPGFDDRLFDETGALRKFVNVFVADDDVRYLDGLDTVVAEGETVSIIPAVAGG